MYIFLLIKNVDDEDDGGSEDGQQQAAEMLYGMIHARFLLTGQGLVAMVRLWCTFYSSNYFVLNLFFV